MDQPKDDGCLLCTNLARLAKMPLEEQQYRTPFGKAADLQRKPCKAHSAIVDKCQKMMRPDYLEWDIKLEKDAMQRTIRVGPNDVWGPRIALLSSPQDSAKIHHCGRTVHPSWIDMDVVKKWKRICDAGHPECDRGAVLGDSHTAVRCPSLLVDTELMRICEASERDRYIALSYVWGGSTQVKLSKSTLSGLMQERSLLGSEYNAKIPKTIQDAIGLVRELGERYLWVDTLCIIQDDEAHRGAQLQAMASIYAGAMITIVAAQGWNADHGLLGIPGVSEPRRFHQELLGAADGHTFVYCPDFAVEKTPWSQRGWTLQESLFSLRKLIFVGNSVEWQCHYAIFREDLVDEDVRIPIAEQRIHGHRNEPSQRRLLRRGVPNMVALESVIQQYTARRFTYSADILPAFAGLASVLGRVFDGGFLFGIPEMFFDAALLWTARAGDCGHRDGSNDTDTLALPSWSWMGWSGLKGFSWFESLDHLRWDFYWCSARIVPLVQWYSLTDPASNGRVIPNHWRRYAEIESAEAPPGWTAHMREYKPELNISRRAPKVYYTHESDPKLEFWYPVPLASGESGLQSRLRDPPGPFIACATKRAFMTLGEKFERPLGYRHEPESVIDVSVYDSSGTWAGCLNLHISRYEELGPTAGDGEGGGKISGGTKHCELAAISTGWAYNDNREYSLTEWAHPKRPKEGERYEWYTVLLLRWYGGVARREGVGRIEKGAWEMQGEGLKEVRLVLN